MQTNKYSCFAHEEDERHELAGVLTAISVVAKRLAERLSVLDKEAEQTEEGGTS